MNIAKRLKLSMREERHAAEAVKLTAILLEIENKFNRRCTYEFRFTTTGVNSRARVENRKCRNALWRNMRSKISESEFIPKSQTGKLETRCKNADICETAIPKKLIIIQ